MSPSTDLKIDKGSVLTSETNIIILLLIVRYFSYFTRCKHVLFHSGPTIIGVHIWVLGGGATITIRAIFLFCVATRRRSPAWDVHAHDARDSQTHSTSGRYHLLHTQAYISTQAQQLLPARPPKAYYLTFFPSHPPFIPTHRPSSYPIPISDGKVWRKF